LLIPANPAPLEQHQPVRIEEGKLAGFLIHFEGETFQTDANGSVRLRNAGRCRLEHLRGFCDSVRERLGEVVVLPSSDQHQVAAQWLESQRDLGSAGQDGAIASLLQVLEAAGVREAVVGRERWVGWSCHFGPNVLPESQSAPIRMHRANGADSGPQRIGGSQSSHPRSQDFEGLN